jgi:hypothetical protein
MAMWATLTSVWHGVGLLSSFELIGATFGGSGAAPTGFLAAMYGMFVHGVTAAGLGILFTALLPSCATCRYATWAGLGFALAVLLAMTFVITPATNPVLRDAIDAIPRSWVIQHALFGVTLGIVPIYWQYYHSEGVSVRMAQVARKALVVRRPTLPVPRPVTSYPRIKRARAMLRRAELFGPARKTVARGPTEAAS